MPSRRNLLISVASSVSLIAYLSGRAAGGEDSFADRVWNDCRPEALYALYTPFVVSLAAGNLDFESYVQYIFQDIEYGKTATIASGLALESAVDPDAKAIFAMFKKGDEDGAIDSQKWLDEHRPGANYPINDATKNYKKFLLDTAHGKIEGYEKPFTGPIVSVFSLASFIPCWKLYYFIGKQIVAAIGNYQDNPYKDWIEGNADDTLGEEIAKIDGVFNKIAASLTREELGIVEKVYRKGMICEIEFFLAQPLFQHTSVPLTRELSNAKEQLSMFSSFDGTGSVVDSSEILATLAISSSADDQAGLKSTWGHLFAQYNEEYELEVENLSSSQRKEFNYDTVLKAFEKFSDIESAKNLRVTESGALKGIKVGDIKKTGEHIILLQDFIKFFDRIAKRQNLDSKTHVISTSWSTGLIEAAFSSVHLNALKVHANELASKESVTTGGINGTIVSPAIKVEVLEAIVKRQSKKLSVYVGKSVEDLLCLLKADIGIVIGQSSSLKRVGTQLGVTFKSLISGSIIIQKDIVKGGRPNWTGSSGTLYTVSSWNEIDAFILGWKNHFG
ncbi:hypothetical protein Tsubulata_026800 [Turnera subulata]|uniref:Thiaminase-2/PQQC domain-containing protein n=1 Tax=Turnera subulata TaxID=218843 RepID=A0A9Q0JR64_9ROSI|nr:hypothetical protein Tsubulata_026800 [Turnera subulata]